MVSNSVILLEKVILVSSAGSFVKTVSFPHEDKKRGNIDNKKGKYLAVIRH